MTNQEQNKIDLAELTLVNFAGKELDIRPFFDGMDICEDLFSSTIQGSVMITDAVDLKKNFPIIGEERLRVRWKTDDSSFKYKEAEFYVYSCSEMEPVNDGSFKYTLFFVSEEFLVSRNLLVRSSYVNKLPHEIVADQLKRVESEKKFEFDETIGVQNYLARNLHPFEVCNEMSARAKSREYPAGAGYLFYEDLDGFKFKTLEKLYTQTKYATYKFSKAGQFSSDFGSNFRSVISHVIDQQSNVADSIATGNYGTTLIVFDPLTRTVQRKAYSPFSEKQYKATAHINGDDPSLKRQTSNFRFGQNSVLGNRKFVCKGPSDNREENILVRSSQLSQLMNGQKITLEVPGDSDMRVGKILELDWPTTEQIDTKKQINDPFLSGEYLVTAVRHFINRKNYVCSLEIMRDTYFQDHEKNTELFDRLKAK